eukprot:694594-Rhodomonas_salina.2
MHHAENKVFIDFIQTEQLRFATADYYHLLQSYIQTQYGQAKVVDIRAVYVWVAEVVNVAAAQAFQRRLVASSRQRQQ